MDYRPQSATLTFRKCDRRSCVNISVVDDSELERGDSFNVTLERTIGLDKKITLNPVVGGIEITDGLKLTIFTF